MVGDGGFTRSALFFEKRDLGRLSLLLDPLAFLLLGGLLHLELTVVMLGKRTGDRSELPIGIPCEIGREYRRACAVLDRQPDSQFQLLLGGERSRFGAGEVDGR